MYTLLSAPLDVQWELTPWCCYNCIHCYNYWRRERETKRRLSETDVERLSQAGQEIVSNGVFHATLTGGEPLGVLAQLFPVLLGIHQQGVHFTINTNLALLDEGLIDLLKKLGIRSILTSLISADQELNDSIAQRKGAYARTVAGIKLAIANGFRVSVNMVVMQPNFHTVYETGAFVASLGADTFCATKVSKPSNCPDFTGYPLDRERLGVMFHELLRVRNDFGIRVSSLEHYPACVFPDDETRTVIGTRNCSAGKTSCTVGFDGEVRPCSHAPMTYGNISRGLQSPWVAMKEWREGTLVPDVCSSTCGEFPRKCGGGCRIEGLTAHGSLNAPDPYCTQAKPTAKRMVGKLELLPETARVRLSERVRFRQETFGYIAYRSSTSWLAIDKTLYAILTSSSASDGVGITDLARAYPSTREDARETLSILRSKNLVELI